MEISEKVVKEEVIDAISPYQRLSPESRALTLSSAATANVIDLISSGSDSSASSDSDDDDDDNRPWKKTKNSDETPSSAPLPLGFLDPLPTKRLPPLAIHREAAVSSESGIKQFWKAGDYEGAPTDGDWKDYGGGMDHVRVHPRFLHSNATSHTWALGAFAELLDNALDEVCNGATFVKVDMIRSCKDGSRMLVIEDNGGGMSPDKIRQCISLGYSAKSKIDDQIGQYGNGFKTSTMRLGADVLVFSRSCGKDGTRSTQSIGLLSYTFLTSTGKEDIVVPILDYERDGQDWSKIIRSSSDDWSRSVETIVQWSPFSSEADLLKELKGIKDHGTRIIIYNLWEDDQGQLELDFDADPFDIQIRGVNRDEKNIQMAELYPNSRHFLTFRHSLRSYVSILYLRLPATFRIILRGKDVEHHNLVNDMMMAQEVTYRPQPGPDDKVPKDVNMLAVVTVGFVKDAKAHIDVQGFNLYHKNRLIKPFWRVWHPPGSDGRGVIGILEANFVEPAHNKQGFERTTVLSKLEGRLAQMQKTYWSTNCHKIGYAPRRNKAAILKEKEDSLEVPKSGKKSATTHTEKGQASTDRFRDSRTRTSGKERYSSEPPSPSSEEEDYLPARNAKIGKNGHITPKDTMPTRNAKIGKNGHITPKDTMPAKNGENGHVSSGSRHKDTVQKNQSRQDDDDDEEEEDHEEALNQLKEENRALRERLKKREDEILGDLLKDLDAEKAKSNSLETQLKGSNDKLVELNKELENLVEIFSEERTRRETEEQNLRKKLKGASDTIQELLDKIKQLENRRHSKN